MKKRIVFILSAALLCLCMALSLTACGKFETMWIDKCETPENEGKAPESGSKVTLEDLIDLYGDDMLAHAEMLIDHNDAIVYEYSCVILNAAQTAEELTHYEISPAIDPQSIARGLFVKCEAKFPDGSELFTEFYNYGVEFTAKQTSHYRFTHPYNNDAWLLVPVDDYGKVLFEMEIVD